MFLQPKLVRSPAFRRKRKGICNHLIISIALVGLAIPTVVWPASPKKLIQGYYKHLYETYKPAFEFPDENRVAVSGAVAFIYLAGHRAEFRGRELSSPIIRRSIERVLQAQADDGSFRESKEGVTGTLESTVAAVLALQASGNSDYQEKIANALKWLQNVRIPKDNARGQSLRFLASTWNRKLDSANTKQLAAWAATLLEDQTQETKVLGLLCAAMARNAATSESKRIPNWEAIRARAGKRLEDFQSSENILGACIAVRALHYCFLNR